MTRLKVCWGQRQEKLQDLAAKTHAKNTNLNPGTNWVIHLKHLASKSGSPSKRHDLQSSDSPVPFGVHL